MAAVRQQILGAARTVFERKGLYEASMSDVSTEAGLSVGSLYVHFRSKEAILLALIETADVRGTPFAACTNAGELLGLVEAVLLRQDGTDSANQATSTALEVAAIARRSAEVKAMVVKNYELLRSNVMDAVVRVGSAAGKLDKAEMLAVGESLLCLLIAAQSQTLIGVPTACDAKVKAARMLVTMLHGAPVRVKR